jgi:hypothetical protein
VNVQLQWHENYGLLFVCWEVFAKLFGKDVRTCSKGFGLWVSFMFFRDYLWALLRI